MRLKSANLGCRCCCPRRHHHRGVREALWDLSATGFGHSRPRVLVAASRALAPTSRRTLAGGRTEWGSEGVPRLTAALVWRSASDSASRSGFLRKRRRRAWPWASRPGSARALGATGLRQRRAHTVRAAASASSPSWLGASLAWGLLLGGPAGLGVFRIMKAEKGCMGAVINRIRPLGAVANKLVHCILS